MVVYENPGPANTPAVLNLVRTRAPELGVETCLVATTSGATAMKAADLLTSLKIVAVSHCSGFREPGHQELSEGDRAQLERRGVKVHTATHAFGTLGRAVRRNLGGYQLDEIMASTLRIFGQGTKVAVEIALMAADAGLVDTARSVISIGGTGEGADTALLLVPANTHNFFALRVQEILCKPALPALPA